VARELCENPPFDPPATPVTEPIVYEQPLNERIRAFLRLEKLFQQYAWHVKHDSAWNNQVAMNSILEILGFTTRSDIKLEVIKELERQHSRLESLSQRPQVDTEQLGSILRNLKARIADMQNLGGQIGKELLNVELLLAIRSKNTLPGAICDFDLPVLHYWHSRDRDARRQHLQKWFEPFRELDRAIQLILDVIRHSAGESREVAHGGFFQQSMDTNQSILMLRIAVPAGETYYPEISAGKHRFSVRFMSNADPAKRPEQMGKDVEFGLQMCSI
jgi:cell division protein ZapD